MTPLWWLCPPSCTTRCPKQLLNAQEARTIAKALPIIKSMGANGQIRKTFVLSVTANSTILDGQLDEVLAAMPADSSWCWSPVTAAQPDLD